MYSTMHPRDKESLQDGDILVPAWAAYTDGRDHMYVLVKCPRCCRSHERAWRERFGLWGCLRVQEECGTPLVVQVLSSTPVFHSFKALMAWAEAREEISPPRPRSRKRISQAELVRPATGRESLLE